ncbi:MAG: hypothetical protein JXR22_13135 [Prolixibacteraceae bacterium]|nr:hypothetical protein [Prolixibacteraceae bacterium]
MKKGISFIMGALFTLVVYAVISGYGNTVIHRGLNGMMINKFESYFINGLAPFDRLKNYNILLKSSREYPGEAITKADYFDAKTSQEKFTAAKWIQEGGFSADEPEIFASFRHFYDPLEPAGERYLKNHLDELDAKGIVNQPKIDHLNWALDHPMHEYNWKNGKTAIISALSTFDEEFRDHEMAFAYRALGETLHMIADMGCPAHVRDDAHASKSIAGYKLGSPDAYEEYSEFFNLSNFDITLVDPTLKTSFQSAETLSEIAHKLAVYTNANFFTGQTIYGYDKDGDLVEPIIHADDPYEQPRLGDCTYDLVTLSYNKTISGQTVMMCKDHYYSRFYKGYPYIDRDCAESQARVLFPQIVEAGANVIRLFTPQLEVKISEFSDEDKFIKGLVKHLPDKEYNREIKYNGKVNIVDVKSGKPIIWVECIDGEFEAEIRRWDFRNVDWKKGITAEIQFGSFTVKSNPYLNIERGLVENIDIELRMDEALVQIKHDAGTVETFKGYNAKYYQPYDNRGALTQSGNSLTFVYNETDTYEDAGSNKVNEANINININLNPAKNSLSFTASNFYKTTKTFAGETEIQHQTNESASHDNVPMTESSGNYEIYELTGKRVEEVMVSYHGIDHELWDKEETLLNNNCGKDAKLRITIRYATDEE